MRPARSEAAPERRHRTALVKARARPPALALSPRPDGGAGARGPGSPLWWDAQRPPALAPDAPRLHGDHRDEADQGAEAPACVQGQQARAGVLGEEDRNAPGLDEIPVARAWVRAVDRARFPAHGQGESRSGDARAGAGLQARAGQLANGRARWGVAPGRAQAGSARDSPAEFGVRDQGAPVALEPDSEAVAGSAAAPLSAAVRAPAARVVAARAVVVRAGVPVPAASAALPAVVAPGVGVLAPAAVAGVGALVPAASAAPPVVVVAGADALPVVAPVAGVPVLADVPVAAVVPGAGVPVLVRAAAPAGAAVLRAGAPAPAGARVPAPVGAPVAAVVQFALRPWDTNPTSRPAVGTFPARGECGSSAACSCCYSICASSPTFSFGVVVGRSLSVLLYICGKAGAAEFWGAEDEFAEGDGEGVGPGAGDGVGPLAAAAC